MISHLASPGRKLALRGVLFQSAVGIVIIALSLVFYPTQWLPVTLGVCAFIIPHSIFAYWVFRYVGASKNQLVAQSLNQGMKIKLILTVIIFVIAFSQFSAHPIFLLGAYAITMFSHWLSMFCLSQMS